MKPTPKPKPRRKPVPVSHTATFEKYIKGGTNRRKPSQRKSPPLRSWLIWASFDVKDRLLCIHPEGLTQALTASVDGKSRRIARVRVKEVRR